MPKKLEVCLTPALLHLYDISDTVTVVIDVLRATSSITYGIDNGAEAIIPVADIEDCQNYRGRGFLLAAERNGKTVEGYDFGNSPFSYTKDKAFGKTIVLTTTNGTKVLKMAQKKAFQVVIGSFLNLTALCNYLKEVGKDVLLLCAGWKDNVNLEDTLFAGAVVNVLCQDFICLNDAGIAAKDIYLLAKDNLREYLKKSSHTRRLKKLNIEEDVKFCLQIDICKAIPVLSGEKLIRLT